MRGSRSSSFAQGRGLGSSQPSAVAAIARVEVVVLRSREGPWVLTAVGGRSMAGSENDQTKKSFWTDSIHDRKPMISCWARAGEGMAFSAVFGMFCHVFLRPESSITKAAMLGRSQVGWLLPRSHAIVMGHVGILVFPCIILRVFSSLPTMRFRGKMCEKGGLIESTA